MKYKAFIFDMDGVLIKSDPLWGVVEEKIFTQLVGKEAARNRNIGISLVGLSISQVYECARSHGAEVSEDEFFNLLNDEALAMRIYEESPLTEDIDMLGKFLIDNNFKLAIVSASTAQWIEKVVARLSFREHINYIVSLHRRDDLQEKPAPDGYVDAIKKLNVAPQETIILEDSNSGIAAAKASGAYTIGFTGNLVPGYKQTGADTYANTTQDVINRVRELG